MNKQEIEIKKKEDQIKQIDKILETKITPKKRKSWEEARRLLLREIN